MPTPVRSAARRALIAALVLALAGCAIFRPDRPAPPAPEPVASELPVEIAAPPPAPAPPPARPAPRPKSPPPPQRDVVVLFQEGSDDYREVAAQILDQLPVARYRTVLVALHAPESPDLLAPLVALRPAIAVAVGREAVDFARAHLASTPLVFCQVFNYQELFESGTQIWGVQPLPPLALQLRGWRTVDPKRKRIGLIVSDAQQGLVAEARAAAGGAVEIKAEISSSDRETLYLFKRLAPQVDGLWLFPDNRILSPAVLRELLSYAVAHGVGVLVPTDALLSWGALMSASSTPADVARNVRGVLDRLSAGTAAGLPAMTPLTEVRLSVNAGVARALGVAEAPQAALVLHEPD
jgi:ABC-type uncharacterized transport system substrate-binding protein